MITTPASTKFQQRVKRVTNKLLKHLPECFSDGNKSYYALSTNVDTVACKSIVPLEFFLFCCLTTWIYSRSFKLDGFCWCPVFFKSDHRVVVVPYCFHFWIMALILGCWKFLMFLYNPKQICTHSYISVFTVLRSCSINTEIMWQIIWLFAHR